MLAGIRTSVAATGSWMMVAVKIVTDDQHRALAFVEATTTYGYRPSSEVLAWHASPKPRGGLVPRWNVVIGRALSQTFASLYEANGEPESVVDHLVRLGWLAKRSDGLELTPLGRALLLAAERIEERSEAGVVVLDSRDPLAPGRLMGELAGFGRTLLIDPYFKIDSLFPLLELTDVDRVLMSKRQKDSRQVRAQIATVLASSQLPRPIEMRAGDDQDQHDRFVLAEDGRVFTIGTSLSGVGGSITLLCPIPEAAAAAVRTRADEWWSAEPLQAVDTSPRPALAPGAADAQEGARTAGGATS